MAISEIAPDFTTLYRFVIIAVRLAKRVSREKEFSYENQNIS
jgi:hypothetical protein